MQNGHLYSPYKNVTGIFIPNIVLNDQSLSQGVKVMFGVLCQYSWKKELCLPRQKVLATRMGVSVRQVRNYIKKLKDEKYIQTFIPGEGKTRMYRLRDEICLKA